MKLEEMFKFAINNNNSPLYWQPIRIIPFVLDPSFAKTYKQDPQFEGKL